MTMSFATDLLSGLTGFRDHLVATLEQEAKPALEAVQAHINRLLPLVHTNVLAAEDEAKAILHELYGSLAGEVKQELTTAPPPTSSASSGSAAVAPTVVESDAQPAPAQPTVVSESGPEISAPTSSGSIVDPTPAPSTTTEASSAPSNTPSASTTEAPAAPAEPTA